MDGMEDYNDYSGQQLSDLERQELESPEGETSPQVYAQLLALYVLKHQLSQAKLLWKRIPQEIKTSDRGADGHLSAVWGVAKTLIQRRPEDLYPEVRKREWPVFLRKIMPKILETTRSNMIQMVSQSYSYISFKQLADMTGATSQQEMQQMVQDLDWSIVTSPNDPSLVFVSPKKSLNRYQEEDNDDNGSYYDRDSSQEQLQKLTEYVSFLENH